MSMLQGKITVRCRGLVSPAEPGRVEDYELAFRMQTEVPDVLDLGREDSRTKAMYGIGQPETDSFGRRCLLARKLVEAGVRFVQLFEAGWDSHDYLERAHTQRI